MRPQLTEACGQPPSSFLLRLHSGQSDDFYLQCKVYVWSLCQWERHVSMWCVCKRERDTGWETYCTVDHQSDYESAQNDKLSTWAASIAAHNTLPGSVCVCGLVQMRLDKMLICISSSDAAWSRPPSTSPRGTTWNDFVCRKNNYENVNRKKGEGMKEGAVSTLHTLKRHRRDRLNGWDQQQMFYLLFLFLTLSLRL